MFAFPHQYIARVTNNRVKLAANPAAGAAGATNNATSGLTAI